MELSLPSSRLASLIVKYMFDYFHQRGIHQRFARTMINLSHLNRKYIRSREYYIRQRIRLDIVATSNNFYMVKKFRKIKGQSPTVSSKGIWFEKRDKSNEVDLKFHSSANMRVPVNKPRFCFSSMKVHGQLITQFES